MIDTPQYELLTARADVTPYIPHVVAAADAERNSFGFLPARAYGEFAAQGRLIIARDQFSQELAGYVVFGGTAAQARIFQTYVAPGHRRRGLAKRLVDEVIHRSENAALLSIRVEIASDLKEADEFYNSCGFRRVRERPGGKSTGRTIVTRVRELRSPSLLDFADYAKPDGPAIRLSLPTAANTLLYLVDLNVYFDVIRRRANALGAGRVFAAAMDNAVSLAIASEFVSELERNTPIGRPDPVLELALTFPRLKAPAKAVLQAFEDELAPIIFPERSAAGTLTERDKSDLAHLATAIEQNATGFITSEKALLRRSDWLRSRHGIDVVSPEVFGKQYTSGTRTSQGYQVRLSDREVSAGDVSSERVTGITEFLRRQDVATSVVKTVLSAGSSVSPRRLVSVQADEDVIALGSWAPARAQHRAVRLYLFADGSSPLLDPAIDYIVESASRDVSVEGPAIVHITLPPEQVPIRTRLLSLGFRPGENSSPRAGQLLKICMGGIVTERNWSRAREQLRTLARLELPEEAPIYSSHDDELTLAAPLGQHATVSIGELEEFVAPCIFALPGRPSVIVPIKPSYVEALFRGSRQPSFLNNQQAALLRQRGYLSNARTYAQIPDNGLIFFYESLDGGTGRACAIAVARIVHRYLAPEGIAQRLASERGVLTAAEVQGMARGRAVCVTEFDNLMMFETPVPLSKLKSIACADDANLVTAKRLTPSSSEALIAEGMPRA